MKICLLIFLSLLFIGCDINHKTEITITEVNKLERANKNDIHKLSMDDGYMIVSYMSFNHYQTVHVKENLRNYDALFKRKIFSFISFRDVKSIPVGTSYDNIVKRIGEPAYEYNDGEKHKMYYFQRGFSLAQDTVKLFL